MKRIISFLLSAALLIGCVGMPVRADDLPQNPSQDVEIEAPIIDSDEFEIEPLTADDNLSDTESDIEDSNGETPDSTNSSNGESPDENTDGETVEEPADDNTKPSEQSSEEDSAAENLQIILSRIQASTDFDTMTVDELEALLWDIDAIVSDAACTEDAAAIANRCLGSLEDEIQAGLNALYTPEPEMDKAYRSAFSEKAQLFHSKLAVLSHAGLMEEDMLSQFDSTLSELEEDVLSASYDAIGSVLEQIYADEALTEQLSECTDFDQFWALIPAHLLDELTEAEIQLLKEQFQQTSWMPMEGSHIQVTGAPVISEPTSFIEKELSLIAGSTETFSVGSSMKDGDSIQIEGSAEAVDAVISERSALTAVTIEAKYFTKEYLPLDELTYHFEENAAGAFTASRGALYLGRTHNSGTYPSTSQAHTLVFEDSQHGNGSFLLKDQTDGYYFALGTSGTLANGIRFAFDFKQNTADSNYSYEFFLFQKKQSEPNAADLIYGYELVTDTAKISGRDLLVAAFYDNSFYIIRPTAKNSWWVEHVAKYSGVSATVSFTARQAITEPITARIGSTQFRITAKHPTNALGALSYAAAASTEENIAILASSEKNHSIVIPSYISQFDNTDGSVFSTLDGITTSVKTGENKEYTVSVTQSGAERFRVSAKLIPGDTYGQLGETQYYTGELTLLQNCLYTYDGNSFYAAVNGTRVYLDPFSVHGIVNQTSPRAVTVTKGRMNDSFHIINPSDGNDMLFFWRWGIFSSTMQSVLGKDLAGTTEVFLYRPVEANETSCGELPGYVRVSEIESGKQYLIGVVYKMDNVTNLYLVHPSTDTVSRNHHVARRSSICTTGSTEFTFTGGNVETGLIPITFQKDGICATYNVRVLSAENAVQEMVFESKTGAASNSLLHSLTISSGMGYQLKLQDSIASGKQVFWLSSDEDLVSIAPNGSGCTMTVHDSEGMQHTMDQIYLYAFVYDPANPNVKTVYKLPVTILKNAYSSTRILDFYFDNLDHTEVYYSYAAEYNTEYIIGTNFFQAYQGDAIYLLRDQDQPWAVNFFAKPNDGYALTGMGATGDVNGDYLKLDAIHAENTEFFNGPAIRNQLSAYGSNSREMLKNMVQFAIDKGCVGAMGFTKFMNNSGHFATALGFISSPVPSISKEVAYVLTQHNGGSDAYDSTTFESAKTVFQDNLKINTLQAFNAAYPSMVYKPGQEVHEGDIVIFKVSMNCSDPGFSFTNLVLEDNLEKSFYLNPSNADIFAGPSSDDPSLRKKEFSQAELTNINDQIKSGNLSLIYYIAYVITSADADNHSNGTELVNTVTMSSTYTATFQGETQQTLNSTARAIVTVNMYKRIGYVNLTIGGTVQANVFFDNQLIPERWKNRNYDAVFLVDGNYTRIPIANGTAATVGNTAYTRFSVSVKPQNFFDVISVYISDETGKAVTETLKFSIHNYVTQVSESSSSLAETLTKNWQVNGLSYGFACANLAKLKTMLNDMLVYGFYCRQYLRMDAPANYQVSVAPALPSEDTIPTNHTFNVVNGDNGIQFTGVALEMDDDGRTGFRIYFQCDGTISDRELHAHAETLKMDYSDGTLYQYAFETKTYSQRSGNYYIRITGLESNWLSNVYKVTITRNGISSSAELSALSYAYLLGKNHTGNSYSDLEYMAAALYKYCISAEDYFQINLPNISPSHFEV